MKIAFKELLFYKKKYLLIELLVVLMMFMVVFLSGLTNGLARAVSASIENMDATYFIVADDADQVITYSSLSEEKQDSIDELGLETATALNIQRGSFAEKGEKDKIDVTYFAVDTDSFIAPEIISGKTANKTDTIVLNDSYKEDGFEIGDKIVDKASEKTLTVVGFTKNSMYGHTAAAYVSKETFVEMNQELNPQYQWLPQAIVTQDEDLSSKELNNLEIVDKQSLISKIPGYSAEQSTLNMILWVLVLAAAAILGVFFYIVTLEKRQQFGVMKALGTKMSEIAYQEISQTFLLSLFGVVLGDGLAILLSRVLPSSMPFFLNYGDVLTVSAAFILICLLAGLISVLKVSRIDPIEIINGGED